jgi:vacuolar-type H+-ATPase subunit E/Vma4
MEGQIFIRCRQSDLGVIKSILEPAVEEYRAMIVSQVLRFQGKAPEDIPCNIIIDTKFLESIEDNENTGCLGGFKLFAKKGRIVCSQTIDDRIDLCFQAAIPAIRYMLFPSMRKGKE